MIRLLRRLAADPEVPRGARLRLWCLLAYLLLPIDLGPDVSPVIGYAEDAIVVALALRSVARRAGPERWIGTGRAQSRNWPSYADWPGSTRPDRRPALP